MKRTVLITLFFLYVTFTVRGQKSFTDITESAGIDHRFEVYEGTFGGGVTVFDLNNDGYEDLFITSGTATDVLYLNNGDGTFTDIYDRSGLESSQGFVTQGAVSADVNRDGFRDLFITTISTTDGTNVIPRAKNLLFLNKGNSTFEDVTTKFGLDDFNSFSTGGSFGDFNADGFPDLFVGNYFQNFEGTLGVLKDATIVSANQTAKPYLLLNREGKKFENVSEDYGINHEGFGFGAVFTDFDNDGNQDLLVNQDFGYKAVPNFLYKNQYPRARFDDVSEQTGMDLKENAMGSAVGDYNNDGLLDYYVTNIKFNLFMVNQGDGASFVDQAKELGAYSFAISWGANFADFDHDGDLDLYVANGDLNPNCTPMGNFYFENEDFRFIEKGRESGTNDYGIGRGSAVFDMENDGDLDIVVVNQKAVQNYPTASHTRLLRNDAVSGNWSKVALNGIDSDKNGIGARVEVVANGIRMIREIDGGGSSHLSQNSIIAHFGLGQASTIDSLKVIWPGGHLQLLTDQPINTLLTITESERPTNYPFGVTIGALAVALLLGGVFFRRKSKRKSS
ncbi:CRTAC1 family protein [Maribacter sp. 2307UL18-2]|uniref:CRTAC1 family protein n=1 Tax=Maribacter sp. 2307UL18-2 TaxID=3386274 RepID=UPI0039BC65FE